MYGESTFVDMILFIMSRNASVKISLLGIRCIEIGTFLPFAICANHSIPKKNYIHYYGFFNDMRNE
jgi:hypothetical protein